MLIASDKNVPAGVELVTPFGERKITCAFHDIDGTHSLIRKWVPVMTLCTGFASFNSWPSGLSPEELANLMMRHDPEEYQDAHMFAVESAGLSALTQMEWAIRNAVRNGVRNIPGTTPEVNASIVRKIWAGEERFPAEPETEEFRNRIGELSSELFRAYEIVLRRQCRDRNLALAAKNPENWRVPGSLEFLRFLKDSGVRNYFVTGAVVEYTPDGKARGSMAEEVEVLGYRTGAGEVVDKLVGSTWNRKLPKVELMLEICREEHIAPENLLIVGDGRSEIAAGVKTGALCLSRLPPESVRAREIHRELGTNLLTAEYRLDDLRKIFLKKSHCKEVEQ